MNIKSRFFLLLFLPFLYLSAGCMNTANRRELNKKNEEIKSIGLELQHKEKTVTDLLDRISWKDQEIGKLTDDLRIAKHEIENLKSDIDKLKKTDLLDRISVKDQEIGKLADTLRTSESTIEKLKDDIEKLKKTDLLDRISVRDQQIGKLTDELHTASSKIENLKGNIGKLREIDVQVEEKKGKADTGTKEPIVENLSEETTGTNTITTKQPKTE